MSKLKEKSRPPEAFSLPADGFSISTSPNDISFYHFDFQNPKKIRPIQMPSILTTISGAEDEIRTRDFHLGKVTLYH